MAVMIDNPEKAYRLARAIASDIMLYNEEKIIKGLQEDNLWDSMSAELDEGRELYVSRVDPKLLSTSNYFEKAIVDVLIYRKGKNVESKIW